MLSVQQLLLRDRMLADQYERLVQHTPMEAWQRAMLTRISESRVETWLALEAAGYKPEPQQELKPACAPQAPQCQARKIHNYRESTLLRELDKMELSLRRLNMSLEPTA